MPILLVPFAADLARRAGQAVAVRWATARFVCEPGGGVTRDAGSLEGGDDPAEIELDWATLGEALTVAPTAPRRALEAASLAALQRLVQRTYVPASERSRRHGAGAGLLDAD
jgi:hypothetical protein